MAPRFHDLTIAGVRPEGAGAVALSFDLPEALRAAYAFRPGQYLTLRAGVGGADLRRSYSIASAPGEALTVGVRHLPGGAFSGFAQGLRAGDRLAVMTPEGRFALPDGARDVLLIAAGSGITPMMAMAQAVLAAGGRVALVYGNRTSETIMFRDRLDALKDRHMARFTLVHVLSREGQDVPLLEGRVDGAKIAALARAGAIDPAAADAVAICGPGGMIDDVAAACRALGVAGDRLHHERFTPAQVGASPSPAFPAPPDTGADAGAEGGAGRGPDPGATIAAVEVILDGARRRFTLAAGDASLIDAAHRQGIELPFSCKGGMCCTCRCKVVDGSAEMAVNYSLEPWEVAAGFTLACQARPARGGALVLDFDSM